MGAQVGGRSARDSPALRQRPLWKPYRVPGEDFGVNPVSHTTKWAPVARVLGALTVAAALLAAATLVYGIWYFPDAPIRPEGSGYRGKTGTPRTLEDFTAFTNWLTALLIVFPLAFGSGFAYLFADSRRKAAMARSRSAD